MFVLLDEKKKGFDVGPTHWLEIFLTDLGSSIALISVL